MVHVVREDEDLDEIRKAEVMTRKIEIRDGVPVWVGRDVAGGPKLARVVTGFERMWKLQIGHQKILGGRVLLVCSATDFSNDWRVGMVVNGRDAGGTSGAREHCEAWVTGWINGFLARDL